MTEQPAGPPDHPPCSRCDRTVVRRVRANGRLERTWHWQDRKTCSPECARMAMSAGGGAKGVYRAKPKPAVVPAPEPEPVVPVVPVVPTIPEWPILSHRTMAEIMAAEGRCFVDDPRAERDYGSSHRPPETHVHTESNS